MPNGRKNRPNGHKIYQHLTLQDTPKFTQNWEFWYENIPSGSPGKECGPNWRVKNLPFGHIGKKVDLLVHVVAHGKCTRKKKATLKPKRHL
jgi:hypothetical protein